MFAVRGRSWIRLAGFSLVALLGLPVSGHAQSARQILTRAESLYNASSIEAARLEFLKVTSSKGQVTVEERVEAYKFLGASYAVLGVKDSAQSYFVAALDNDPFTILEPTFGGDEQAAFAVAKKQIFKAGIEPIHQQALDPSSRVLDSSTYTFRVVTTHAAKLTVDLVLRGDSSKHETLYSGSNDGTRDVPWSGILLAQRPDSGIYELHVTATDALPGVSASTAQATAEKPSLLFRLSHVYEPLEDTLPSLTLADTLVSENSRLAPVWDFTKGLSVAAIATAIPLIVLQRTDLQGWGTHAAVGVSIGLTSGTAAALFGSKNPQNKAAVAENARRKRQRDAFNAGVRARNAARLAKTILVVRPLTGGGGP